MPQIKVKDVMVKKDRLVTASPDESVKDAAIKMYSRGVGSVLIVENDKLLGIFTERDLVKVVASDKPVYTKLKDVMTTGLITVSPEESLSRAALIMSERNIRHLPVVENDRLVGIVSARDIAKYYSQVMEEFE